MAAIKMRRKGRENRKAAAAPDRGREEEEVENVDGARAIKGRLAIAVGLLSLSILGDERECAPESAGESAGGARGHKT